MELAKELENLTRMLCSNRHFMLVAESPAAVRSVITSATNRSTLNPARSTSEVEGSRVPRVESYA